MTDFFRMRLGTALRIGETWMSRCIHRFYRYKNDKDAIDLNETLL